MSDKILSTVYRSDHPYEQAMLMGKSILWSTYRQYVQWNHLSLGRNVHRPTTEPGVIVLSDKLQFDKVLQKQLPPDPDSIATSTRYVPRRFFAISHVFLSITYRFQCCLWSTKTCTRFSSLESVTWNKRNGNIHPMKEFVLFSLPLKSFQHEFHWFVFSYTNITMFSHYSLGSSPAKTHVTTCNQSSCCYRSFLCSGFITCSLYLLLFFCFD